MIIQREFFFLFTIHYFFTKTHTHAHTHTYIYIYIYEKDLGTVLRCSLSFPFKILPWRFFLMKKKYIF